MTYGVDSAKKKALAQRTIAKIGAFIGIGLSLSFPIIVVAVPFNEVTRVWGLIFTLSVLVLSVGLGLFLAIRKVRNEIESLRFTLTESQIRVESQQQLQTIQFREIRRIELSPEMDITIRGINGAVISIPRETENINDLLASLQATSAEVTSKRHSQLLIYLPAVMLGTIFLLLFFKLYIPYVIVAIPFGLVTVFISYSVVKSPNRWRLKLLPLGINLFLLITVARNSYLILASFFGS